MLSEGYGGEAMKKSSVSEWYKQLEEGSYISKSQMKVTLNTLYDIESTVHFKFIPQGQTLNQAYYVEILKRLREAVL
jgi:hypothetical protein